MHLSDSIYVDNLDKKKSRFTILNILCLPLSFT